MQVWIDDQQLSQVDNLEAAFELARQHTQTGGRLIIDILADGSPIDEALIDTPPSDSTAGIRELRNDPEHARAMGKAARAAALERFGLARFLADWDRLLQEVVR